MMVAGLISAFVIIILIDLPALLKANNRMKTIIVYSALIVAGFTISLLLVIGKKPISPSQIIEKIVKGLIG